jgi:hypothetical protein
MISRPFAALPALALCVAGLSGCVVSPGPFDAQQVAADLLPAEVAAFATNVDLESTRYQGEFEGTSIWVGRGSAEDANCIVTVNNDQPDQAFATCGGDDVGTSLDGGGPEVRFTSTGAATSLQDEGWTALSDWVVVR